MAFADDMVPLVSSPSARTGDCLQLGVKQLGYDSEAWPLKNNSGVHPAVWEKVGALVKEFETDGRRLSKYKLNIHEQQQQQQQQITAAKMR